MRSEMNVVTWAFLALLSGVANRQNALAEDDPPKGVTHVVLIGGFDSDPTPQQLVGTARRGEGNSGLYQLRNDLRKEKISADYFNWNGTPPGSIQAEQPPGAAAIADYIREQFQNDPAVRIGIVGNSWGGHTAWEVCRSLADSDPELQILLLIFLDPSSAGRPDSKRPKALPKNVNAAVQYASKNVVVWSLWQKEPRVTHVDLADKELGFLRPGGPPYGALFSPDAHVGAEWDELIHRDIRRRLKGEPPRNTP